MTIHLFNTWMSGFETGLFDPADSNKSEFSFANQDAGATLELSSAFVCDQYSRYSLKVATVASGRSFVSIMRRLPGEVVDTDSITNTSVSFWIMFPVVPTQRTNIVTINPMSPAPDVDPSIPPIDPGTPGTVSLFVNPYGKFENNGVRFFSQTGTSAATVVAGQWHHVEVEVFGGEVYPNGQVHVRIDGTEQTGMDFVGNVGTDIGQAGVTFGIRDDNEANAPTRYYDSIIIYDYLFQPVGSSYRIGLLKPASVVSGTWTVSGSSHYGVLSTIPWVSSPTNYITSTTPNQLEILGMSGVAYSDVLTIQPIYRATDFASGGEFYNSLVFNGNASGTFLPTPSKIDGTWRNYTITGAYYYHNAIGDTWQSNIINNAKLHLKSDASGNQVVISNVFCYVAFSPSSIPVPILTFVG